jgi:DEAD/DEAH box helicase domain-containing protein
MLSIEQPEKKPESSIPRGEHGNYHAKYNVLDLETLRLDVEVGGWSTESVRKMGISCCIMHSFDRIDDEPDRNLYLDCSAIKLSKDEIYNIFDHQFQIYDIQHLFFHLAGITTEKKLLIGHNIIKFDMEVMHGTFAELGLLSEFMKSGIPSPLIEHMMLVDTMTGFGRRVKLDDLAWEVLGRGKSGNGALAPINWKDGKYEEVIKYCDNDVQLTADIYREYLKNGHVKFKGRRYWTGWRM